MDTKMRGTKKVKKRRRSSAEAMNKELSDSEPLVGGVNLFSSKHAKAVKCKSSEKTIHGHDDNDKLESEGRCFYSFEELGLHPTVVRACHGMQFEKPTPIQSKCIPPIMAGKNVIGGAETGSGKTAAFALPVLHELNQDPYGVFALVLTPTRELAIQISEQFEALGANMGLRQLNVIGGLDMISQSIALSNRPHVVVGTPGRLLDHFKSSTDLRKAFSRLRFLVLDEADRLLSGTQLCEINNLMQFVPGCNLQVLLFTATPHALPSFDDQNKDVHSILRRKYCVRDERPKMIHDVKTLEHKYMFMPRHIRDAYLIYLLMENSDTSIIVFTATCFQCALLRQMLAELDISAVALHSQMKQHERIASLQQFKSKLVQVLVATDVASRGLDIPFVDIVVNYDLPSAVTDYVHRAGRTARAGRSGLAVSLVTQYDVDIVKNIEECMEKTMTEYKHDEESVLLHLTEATSANRIALIALREAGFGQKHRSKKRSHTGSEAKNYGQVNSKPEKERTEATEHRIITKKRKKR